MRLEEGEFLGMIKKTKKFGIGELDPIASAKKTEEDRKGR